MNDSSSLLRNITLATIITFEKQMMQAMLCAVALGVAVTVVVLFWIKVTQSKRLRRLRIKRIVRKGRMRHG